MGGPPSASFGKDLKRGVLGVLTSGTSEIKTGGGVNKDETVADTLFPKAVNDVMLDDRTNARNKTAADAQAQKDQLDALGNEQRPDMADALNRRSRGSQMLRMLSSKGRSSTFLTGPLGGSSSGY